MPLLNAQQVVLVWQQGVPKGNRWDAQTVPVNVGQKGLYLVEATNGTLRAYTIVSVTDLGIIAKGAPGRVRARVVDRITGAPVANAPVVLWSTHAGDEAGGTAGTGAGRVGAGADAGAAGAGAAGAGAGAADAPAEVPITARSAPTATVSSSGTLISSTSSVMTIANTASLKNTMRSKESAKLLLS